MTNELTLADLHDIVVPEAVSAWPPAPGVWFALVLVMLIVAWITIHKIRIHHRNAYRRQALAELESAGTAVAMAEILKRTALTAYPRDVVTGLSGDVWFQWLEAEGGFQCPEEVRKIWSRIYSEDDVETGALKSFTKKWITNHAGI